MTALLDSRPHAEAVKAAIRAKLSPSSPATAHVYDYDDVPSTYGNAGTLPNIFVVLSVERRAGSPLRGTGRTGTSGWRIALRGVGRTVDESRFALLRAAEALDGARLTVSGEKSTPVLFETDQAPEYDDGRWSGSSVWTYVL